MRLLVRPRKTGIELIETGDIIEEGQRATATTTTANKKKKKHFLSLKIHNCLGLYYKKGDDHLRPRH